jgi:outer membrane protein TolC
MKLAGWMIIAMALAAEGIGTATAEDTRTGKGISLDQAIERAVAGNADLRRERVAVSKAQAQRLAAEGKFDLVLDARLQLGQDVVPTLCDSADCQDFYAGRTTTANLGVGISRNLESGGSLRLGLDTSRSRSLLGSTTKASVSPGAAYASNLALTFTHPLLRGLGAEVAEANVRKARIAEDLAQLGRQMRACNVVRDVVLAYWELAYGTQDLAIRRSALALAEEQLRTTQAMIAAGRLADADAASVERAIAQRQEELAIAEKNLFLRNLDLWRLFGLAPENGHPALAAMDEPSPSSANIDAQATSARAIEANPQLRALRLGLGLSELDIATARSSLRPRLDVMGSVGTLGRTTGLGASVQQATAFGDMAWSAGLAFELPMQNRGARGRLREAQDGLQLANIDAEDFARELRDLVLRTTSGLRTAARRVELGNREVAFAQQSLDAEKARFQAGRATNNDVLLRQQELKDAETRLLRARIDQAESEAALAALTGDILDLYGVTLKGL